MKLTIEEKEIIKFCLAFTYTAINDSHYQYTGVPDLDKMQELYSKIRGTLMHDYKNIAKKKSSDFYPNADEDGMVNVSDYPYTKY
jgi:hypothetical protein